MNRVGYVLGYEDADHGGSPLGFADNVVCTFDTGLAFVFDGNDIVATSHFAAFRLDYSQRSR